MGFDHRRTVTYRLAQAAHAYRVRAGRSLSPIDLHSGQEAVLKALGDNDRQSMSDLAATLGVQPPTMTKVISRLSAQDYVERRTSVGDGRQVMVYLTERGRRAISAIDKVWKRIEKDAVSGIDEKERKKLGKLLRQVEKNLRGNGDDGYHAADDDEHEVAQATADRLSVP